MIWAAFPGLRRPRIWVRWTIDVALVVLGGYLFFLAVLDREAPYSDLRGHAVNQTIRRGDYQEISWLLIDRRYCGEGINQRFLSSAADPDWFVALPWSTPQQDPDVPRPLQRSTTSEAFRIPMTFPHPPEHPDGPTKAYYEVDIYFACNWLQELLPRRFWIRQRLPTISFTVHGYVRISQDSPALSPAAGP